jgi:Zn-dependent oligopeptidase
MAKAGGGVMVRQARQAIKTAVSRVVFCLLATAIAAPGCSGPRRTADAASTSGSPSWEEVRADPIVWGTKRDVERACDRHLALIRELRQRLRRAPGPRTASNTLVPYNELLLVEDRISTLSELMSHVHSRADVRAAAQRCSTRVLLEARVFADAWQYRAVLGVDERGLDGGAARFRRELLRRQRRLGLHRDAPDLSALRKRHARALRSFEHNIEQGSFTDNLEVARTLLEIRHAYARRLGYTSYADYIAPVTVFRTRAGVSRFLDEVSAVVRPRAEWELFEAQTRKARGYPWPSISSCSELDGWVKKMRSERRGGPDEIMLFRLHFVDVRKVVSRILSTLGKAFSMDFRSIPRAARWHPSVMAYDLYEGDNYLGRLYLDLAKRLDKSYPSSTWTILQCANHGRHPCSVVVMQLLDSRTGVVRYDELTTLLHELGHALHNLLSADKRWFTDTGKEVGLDIREMPSMTLQRWAELPGTIVSFSQQYETGKRMEMKMARRFHRAQQIGRGYDLQAYLQRAAINLDLHARDPSGFSLGHEMKRSQTFLPCSDEAPLEWFVATRDITRASLIYHYLWSEVVALEVLSRLSASGSEAAEREVFRRFKETILRPGASRSPSSMIESFLGGRVTYEDLKRWIGESDRRAMAE